MRSTVARRVLGLDVAIESRGRARHPGRSRRRSERDSPRPGRRPRSACDLAGQQPDLADEMLRAGMMAAGEMDVDRRVERDARLAPARDLLGVALGIGGGELAAGIAGAGDEAGANRVGLVARPSASIRACAAVELVRRHAGDQQVLPDREPDIAVAEFARDLRRARASARRSAGRPAGRRRSSCRPACFCAMHADMRGAIERRARRHRTRHGAIELAAEFLLDQPEEFLDARARRARI